jgi:hypothetical protein
MTTRITNPDGSTGETWPITPGDNVYRNLLEELCSRHWSVITVGPIIQGAAFEWRFAQAPKIGYLDGYLTVSEDGERSPHFHVCVGEHRGTIHRPVSPELAAWRRTARGEFFRDLDGKCLPATWGLRLFNGRDEQQLSVYLPNPHLDPVTMRHRQPVWSALDLWHDLRLRYAGVPADAQPCAS